MVTKAARDDLNGRHLFMSTDYIFVTEPLCQNCKLIVSLVVPMLRAALQRRFA